MVGLEMHREEITCPMGLLLGKSTVEVDSITDPSVIRGCVRKRGITMRQLIRAGLSCIN